jgi:Fe-S-cluster containining protein
MRDDRSWERRNVVSEDRDHSEDLETEEGYFTEEQRAYIREMVEKLMEKRILVVYGDEDATGDGVCFDDEGRRKLCRAVCCSFIFALTKRDVERGVIRWNEKRPYFIAKDEDGYCPHLERETLRCKVWEDRPERCRNYDCRRDKNVWEDWDKRILNKDVFNHLSKRNECMNDQGGKDGKSEECA